MKKTLFKAFGVLALAVTMVLASCSTDASNISSQIDTVLTLSAPEVKVTAYPGMNYVSWKPVANAQNYQVYIYEDGHFLRSSSQLSYTVLKYVDTNIKNGAKYTYIVEAESKSSTGRSVVTENSKSAEVSVTAIVPDYNVKSLELNNHEKGIGKKGNEKFVIKPDNIHVARDGFDKFSVSFPSKAYLGYEVLYSIGNENTVWRNQRPMEDSNGSSIIIEDNASNDKIAYTDSWPITVSGKYTVAVLAYAINEHFGTSDWVVSSEVINVEELLGEFDLDPSSSNPYVVNAKWMDDGAKARIYFSPFILEDGSIAPASYYKVYRSTTFKPYDYELVEGTVKAASDIDVYYYIDDTFGENLPNNIDYNYTIVVTDGTKFAGSSTGDAPVATLAAYALDDQNATYIFADLECNDEDALENDVIWTIVTPSQDVEITGVYTVEKDADDEAWVVPSEFDTSAAKNLVSKLIKQTRWNGGETGSASNPWINTNNNVYTLYDANHTVGKNVFMLVTTKQAGHKDAEFTKDDQGDDTYVEIKPLEVTDDNLWMSASSYDNTQAFNNMVPSADRTENDVIVNVTDQYEIGKDSVANYTYTLYRATSTFKKLNTRWNYKYDTAAQSNPAADPEDDRGPHWLNDIVFSASNDWVSLGTLEMKRNNAYNTNTGWSEYKAVYVDTADLEDGYYVYKVIKSDKAGTAGNYVTATADAYINTGDEIEFVPTLTTVGVGASTWNGNSNATENINLEFTKANSTNVGDPIWIAGHETESEYYNQPSGYVSETIETGAEYKLYRATLTAGQTEKVFEYVASFTNGQPQYSAEYNVYKWDSSAGQIDPTPYSTTYKYITSYKYTYIDTARSTANSYEYVIVVSKPGCDDKLSNFIRINGAN